jgi:hypothetical protein
MRPSSVGRSRSVDTDGLTARSLRSADDVPIPIGAQNRRQSDRKGDSPCHQGGGDGTH